MPLDWGLAYSPSRCETSYLLLINLLRVVKHTSAMPLERQGGVGLRKYVLH